MKRTTSIVLFASIFAIAAGALSFGGNSATSLMVSAVPQSQEQVGVLGHVEYKVFDNSGNLIKYMQNDNIVVHSGKTCASERLFGDVAGATCSAGTFYNYIGIGNYSSATVANTNATLGDATDNKTGNCANTDAGVGQGGEMARRQVTASIVNATGGTGAVVTLDTSSAPFTFNVSNATTVYDSGVFNNSFETPGTQCAGSGETGGVSGVNWDMFSRQLLSSPNGIVVNSGDSLAVKWTITVG